MVLSLFLLGTASCGFTPVYAPRSDTPAELSEISVAPPQNNRTNFILVAELENRVGRNVNGNKLLKHNITLSEVATGILSDAARIQLFGRVVYSVVSNKDGRTLYRGSVENFVSYSTDRSVIASPRDDAIERLVSILADQIFTKLIAQFY